MYQTIYTEYAQNHKGKLNHHYKELSERLENSKQDIVSTNNKQCPDNNEFCLKQTVFKENHNSRNKKKNSKYLDPYEITQLLDRNRVELTSKSNTNKKEIIHIKELKKTPVITDLSCTSSQ